MIVSLLFSEQSFASFYSAHPYSVHAATQNFESYTKQNQQNSVFSGYQKKCLDFLLRIRYNSRATRRVVRAGRRSTTGNRVSRQRGFEGSNPLLSARVRIPCSPPKKNGNFKKKLPFFLFPNNITPTTHLETSWQTRVPLQALQRRKFRLSGRKSNSDFYESI